MVDPKLHESGWTEKTIVRERYITRGKIINESGDRLPGRKPDYTSIILIKAAFRLP